MTNAMYSIPEQNLTELTETIARIAKRAARLSLTPVTMTVGDSTDVPYVGLVGTRRPWVPADGELSALELTGEVVYRRYLAVTISGDAPTVDGWDFVATLQHVQGEAGESLCILRTVPTFEGQLPARFRTATPDTCEHCQAKRRRNETFVVRKAGASIMGAMVSDALADPGFKRYASASLPAGTWLQVGRNCLADFFPGQDPQRLAARLAMVLDACGAAQAASMDDGWGESGGGGGERRWPLRRVLAVAATLVRVDGWMSRGKARDTNASATADDVITYLNPPRGGVARDQWEKWVAGRVVSDADVETATLSIAYAREALGEKGDARDDYEHNLYVAVSVDSVDSRMMGIVCSLISYYKRMVEREVARRSGAASQHVGAVKECLALRALTLASVRTIDGSYGTSYLHTFRDTSGNVFKWFASKKSVGIDDAELVEGQTYAVWGTVKGHGEYKGVKETSLTRCVVTTPEAMDAELARLAEKATKKAAAAAKKAAKAAKAVV